VSDVGLGRVLAAWAVNEIVIWFISLFEDQVFDPKLVSMSRPYPLALNVPPNWTWDGTGQVYKTQTLNIYGHGAHYQVRYDWRESDWVKGAGYPLRRDPDAAVGAMPAGARRARNAAGLRGSTHRSVECRLQATEPVRGR
jgi:hypothetical protein